MRRLPGAAVAEADHLGAKPCEAFYIALALLRVRHDHDAANAKHLGIRPIANLFDSDSLKEGDSRDDAESANRSV